MKVKKFLSFLLVLTMLLSCCPVAMAAESTSGECGDNGSNVTWTLDSDGTVTISGTGKIKNYDFYPNVNPWKELNVKKIVIGDGVTSIGEYAFYGCYALTSVTILDTVTSIGKGAFDDCWALTSVTIPNSVTSIGDGAFQYCKALTSITIPSSVTSIGNSVFSGCKSLTHVTIPDSVTSIGGGVFYNCQALTSITIPESVDSIGVSSFDYCTALTDIVVDGNNTSYTSEDGVLLNKDKTTLLRYPNGKQGAYVIPNSVTSIGDGAFQYCQALTSITIPSSVTSIGKNAFYYCDSLTEITFEGDAPTISDTSFSRVTATAYYPANNDTWTNTVGNNYSGTLTWKPCGFAFSISSAAVTKGETATVSLVLDTAVNVLAGTVTISATDSSGNKLDVTGITPNSINGCEIDYEGAKILIATEGTIAAGTKIADISFATNTNTVAGDYTVTLVSDLYTGDMDSDENDQKLEFAVNEGIISVSEVPVTVTWQNEDGTVLETDEKVAYGSTPVYDGATPQKASTVQYNYTFNGWTPAVGAVTEDTFYTATYTETLRSYPLTFKDESGTIIKTLTVPYGTEPEAIEGIPAVPAKEATAEYTYTANDWNVQKVTGEAIYTATYTASKNSYTITWKNDDGSTLGTTTVEYGQTPTYAAPSNATDVGYTYSFSKWDPSPSSVTGPATYQAVYTAAARPYTVSVAGIVEGATFVLKDSNGAVVEPVDGKYTLTYDQTYSYTINAIGYKPVESSFTVSSENSGFAFESGAGTAVLTFAAMEKFIGDTNGDGAITIADAQALYNYLLDRYELDNEGKAYYDGQLVFNLNVADVNGNATVGADDILPMLRLINASAGN